MNEKKNAWNRKDGAWEYNGEVYSHVARIKADKLLKNPEFRDYFRPRSFVHYCANLISKEEIGEGNFIYLASVKNVEGDDTRCRPIPLGLLEFTTSQKKEIIKVTGFPKSAFEKIPVIKNEEVFDEPFGVELDGVGYLDDYLDVGSNLGL
jgi:hypothetical protein